MGQRKTPFKMNDEEYQNRLEAIEDQLDNLQFTYKKARIKLENKFDDDFSDAKEYATSYSQSINDFKISNQKIINQIEDLQNSTQGNYRIDINRIHDDLSNKLDILYKKEEQISSNTEILKQAYLSQDEELQADYKKQTAIFETQIDGLNQQYYR